MRFGVEVRAIEQDADGVTVRCRRGADRVSFSADYAICTLPFSVLRTVEHTFSHDKERAIRQLNYHASTKILFQVRHRFWEESDGIVGGATVTDLPIRRMNYPPADPSTDARRPARLVHLGPGRAAVGRHVRSTSGSTRRSRTSSRIHPEIRREFELGASHAWYGDRWARGAFAMFAPEQQTTLQADIVRPEGRVFFAGEHCSLYHAWIQGALESGIRAAREINEMPAV